MSQTELLDMEHITMEFPGVKALDDVQFHLGKGQIHALLGENGAGKSTLIKVLTGINRNSAGTITMNGKVLHIHSPLEAQNEGISTVYQEVNLCPDLSVAENIYIGRQPMKGHRIDWKKMNRDAKTLVKDFDLDIDVEKTLDNYSVAVQQMVAIARAVDIHAQILILDEPTSSLSTTEVEKLFTIMRRLKDNGMGIVFVTHFLDQVYEVADHITVLRNGKYVGTWTTEELPRIELVGKMIGKDYSALAEITHDKSKQPVDADDAPEFLHTEELSSGYIKNINVTLRKGVVTGFSGLLGSGRSESARMIFGADKPLGGKLVVEGKETKIKNPLDAIRNDFAFCPEDRKKEGIIGDLTIRENITIALQAKRGLTKMISRKEADEIAQKLVEELKIKTPSLDQKIKNLSGGNQQKVILARWLATDPKLLILDEPTRGIDIGAKAEIQKLVVDLADNGLCCLFISSELEEMERTCSKMYVLRDKKIVGELNEDEISEANIMKTIAGEEAGAQ